MPCSLASRWTVQSCWWRRDRKSVGRPDVAEGAGFVRDLIRRLQQCVSVCERCSVRGVASSLLNVLTVTLDSLCAISRPANFLSVVCLHASSCS